MNFFAVIALVAIAIGVALGFLVQLDPGYIRISWLNWLIETNVWIGFLLFVAFYFAFHFTLRSVVHALAVKAGISRWRSKVHARRAQRYTKRGLLEYAEGNWKRAQRHLAAGASDAEVPLINYLAAAQAANEIGNDKASEEYLKRAYDVAPEGEVAIGVTQAQLQLGRGANEQALSTLLRLRKKAPEHPFVLKLLVTTYQRLSDWGRLADLLPEVGKAGILKEPDYARLQSSTWENLLRQAAEDSQRKPESENQTGPLNAVWEQIPTALRKDEAIVDMYASSLVKLKAPGHAEKVLQQALRLQWSERLILSYGLLESSDTPQQLAFAEQSERDHKQDAALYLTIGRLALRQEDWDKARTALETSYGLKRRADCATELARLLVKRGQYELALPYLDSIKPA